MINFKFKSISVLLFLSLLAVISRLSPAQETQGPPPEIQKLYSLEGKWEGNITMEMEGKTYNGKGTYICSKISDGWGLLMDETIDIEGMGKYLGHNIIGYDLGEGKYHIYTVSNFAQVHDHAGGWKDDKTMYFEHKGIIEGKPHTEKVSIIVNGQDEWGLDVSEILDGKVTGTFKGSIKRVK